MIENTAQKIQIAADIIHDELARRGTPADPAVCLALAKRLHELWSERVAPRRLQVREVEQLFRERYNDKPVDWPMLEGPLGGDGGHD